jgi:hypothetical protein
MKGSGEVGDNGFTHLLSYARSLRSLKRKIFLPRLKSLGLQIHTHCVAKTGQKKKRGKRKWCLMVF